MIIGAAPETNGPALVVESGGGTRGGGGCPARNAARNGETPEGVLDVVEAVEIDAAAAEIVAAATKVAAAAVDSKAAAEDVDRFSLVIPCETKSFGERSTPIRVSVDLYL